MAKGGLFGVVLRSFVLALVLIVVVLTVLSFMTYNGTCAILDGQPAPCGLASYLASALYAYIGSLLSLRGLLVIGMFLMLLWPVSFGLLLIISPVRLGPSDSPKSL